MKIKELHRALAPYWRPYKFKLSLGLFCLLCASSLIMVQPWVMKLAIDDLGSDDFSSRIWIYVSVILAVTCLVCTFRFMMRLLLIGVSRRVEHDMRRRIFQHILILPRAYFDTVSSGDIMSRMTNDILKVRMILGPALMQISNTVISLLFALSFMLAIDVRLTLLSLIPLPMMPVMFYFMGKKIRFYSEQVQEQIAEITSCVQENLTGIRIVKAYNLEPTECVKFDGLSNEYVRRNLDLVRFQGLFTPLMTLLSGISTCVILLFCGWWVIAGRISIGSMVAFLEYLAILSWPMFAVGWVAGLIQQGSAAMQRIQSVLNEEPCIGMLQDAGSDTQHHLIGDVTFKDVSFRYHPNQPYILDKLNFTIKSGETVAIMGASGSGKTTIINLITRSYLPTSGSVYFNGYSTDSLPEYKIRETVGIMPQNIVLFSDSIANNLDFGVREMTDMDVEDVLHVAHLKNEITEFPDRLETRLGERGVNISGGQKQRITLARMLLRDPDIILLDDPFSSVDIATEEAILEKMPVVIKNKTMIIVSHRMNTARRADRIFILKDGRIDEEGTHESLVASGGYYADLCRRQSLIDELESY